MCKRCGGRAGERHGESMTVLGDLGSSIGLSLTTWYFAFWPNGAWPCGSASDYARHNEYLSEASRSLINF